MLVLAGRELYVEELQQHVAVDVFGDCGELLCNKDDMAECYTLVLQPTYKFYLAFENSMCEDYITEKVREMDRGLIIVQATHVTI